MAATNPTTTEIHMPATQTPLAPATHTQRVLDAIVAAGYAVGDPLDEGQTERATAVDNGDKSGLRGKSLGIWIMEAKSTKDQIAEGRLVQEAADHAKRSEAAVARGTGFARSSEFPENIHAAVKAAIELRGAKAGSAAKDHADVRRIVTAEIEAGGKKVSPTTIAKAAGVKNVAELRAIATKSAPNTPLKPLTERLKAANVSKWGWGLQAAAILTVWADEIKK